MPEITPEIIAAQVKDRSRRLIKATGEVVPFDTPQTLQQIEKLVGANFKGIDTVNLRHLGRPLVVMSVDGGGYEVESVETGTSGGFTHIEQRPISANKPVNVIATALYHANCIPGTTHQIVGDVFIASDEDFAADEELA